MKVFQLNDSDNESMGLIETDLPETTITKEWLPFYLESHDCGADTFAEHLNTKFPESTSRRFFVDAEITL